jgi:phage tail-like protein
VTLLNARDRPSMTWIFTNAYPLKCSFADLNAQDDKMLIEALEFAYTDVKRAAPAVE